MARECCEGRNAAAAYAAAAAAAAAQRAPCGGLVLYETATALLPQMRTCVAPRAGSILPSLTPHSNPGSHRSSSHVVCSATGGSQEGSTLRRVVVHWSDKGYGFIRPAAAGSANLFCHHSSIQDGSCLHVAASSSVQCSPFSDLSSALILI